MENMTSILEELTRQGYELAYDNSPHYRQGKVFLKILNNQKFYFDVFYEKFGSTDYRLVIELLFTEGQKPSFRVHLQVPGVFRVVNPWRDLEGGAVKPILDSIEELKLEMRRELIEIDCI